MLVAAAVLFSTGGAAIKAVSLTPWQVAFSRSIIAAAVLLLAIPQSRRGWSLRTAPVALAYASTLVLFVLANRTTTAANAIFLQSAAPLYLLLLSPWLLKEHIRRSDVAYIIAIAIGLALLFLQNEKSAATAPDPVRGNIYAAASGLTYALTLAGLRWLGRGKQTDPGIATVAMGNLMVAAALFPLAMPIRDANAVDVAVMLYMGVFQVGLAYVFVTRALRHVPALEANTVLLLEPALNPVWVWLLHGERPGRLALLGGAVILASTLWNASRQTPRPISAE